MTRGDETSTGPVEPARAIAVVGMHRSGTSAITGSLAEAGVYLGNVLGHSIVHNRKGLQEPEALVFMHENLLRFNGGSWDNPPQTIKWDRLHTSVRDLFLESRRNFRPWAFKDPRTLLVLEGWLEACPDLFLTGIFRHPLLVAQSLQRRNGFSIMKGLDLWQVYNQRLIEWSSRASVPIIEFTHESIAMQSRLVAIRAMIGLTSVKPSTFYDAAIPAQFPPQEYKLPSEIERLYQGLKEIAIDPQR